jgi:transcription-repair coupling factor (superfamily II helicase)
MNSRESILLQNREFSVRGGIVDVFSNDNPYRIEFLG